MKSVFRKSALDRISSPEQLDKVLKVTSPMSWLALLAVTVMLVFVVVWSFVGSLPTTVTATGVVVNVNTSTNTVYSKQRGTVQRVIPNVGEVIRFNSPVIELATSQGTETFNSDVLGVVTEILVKPGDVIDNRTEILRTTTQVSGRQKEVVVCYVPISDADKIEMGDPVQVTLNMTDSSAYGFMYGRVINVDAWATSQRGLSAVVGSDNSMESTIRGQSQGICAIGCELAEDENTVSKYSWSNEKGKTLEINAPQMCTVRIITETSKPIEKLFVKLKDIWEGK